MKAINLYALFILGLLTTSFSFSQSYIGHSIDNYSGIHGVIANPANIVDSRMRTDINLGSASVFTGSDYFGINISDVINNETDFDNDVERSPKNDNNFFANADVVGPSFMLNLNEKSSIGLITRARVFYNVNNLNGNLYESIDEDFNNINSFDFDSSDLVSTTHTWAEIGIAYGRILMQKDDHFLKGGVTLKLLQGGGAGYYSSPGLSGSYNNNGTTETLATQGSIIYGTSQSFDSDDDFNFDDLSTGFGVDLGFVYEWRKDNSSTDKKDNKYKLKLGLSITDIGSISYKNSSIDTYDLNNTVTTENFNDADDFLDNNYTFTQSTEKITVKLPTALNINADYHLKNKFYVSLLTSLSLVKNNTALVNKINNSVSIAPRLETKWFSFYSPISFRQYGDFGWGAGFRVGPLTVGSGSVLSNLISDSSKTTDVYVGLKVPIYQ